MNNDDLIKKISEDNETENLILSQLRIQLDEEMKKPFKKRDYNKIEALSCEIAELSIGRKNLEAKASAGASLLKQKLEENPDEKIRRKRIHPALAAVGCFAAVIIVLNTISLTAFGMNIFSAAVKFTKGAISFSLSDDSLQDNKPGTSTDMPQEQLDAYGIKAKCIEHNVSAEVPHYLPEGFELDDFIYDKLSVSDDLYFYFTNGEAAVNITFQSYHDPEDIPDQIIPSETYDVSDIEINGHSGYIIKENNQFTALYQSESTVCIYYASGVDYDEFIQIINSIE